MCQRVICPSCDRPTYAGCGKHVEQVLGDVPVAKRCQCDAQAPAATKSVRRSWFGSRRS